jgi:fibronectin type 3 domain-containing protein
MLQNNTFSPFRKLEISCLHALSFIFILAFILFISTTNVYSAQVTWVWSQNTESDLAGYKIYIGSSSGNYNNVNDVGNQTSYATQNLVEGQTYYVAVTAYDLLNNESGYSAEVVYTVPILNTNQAPVLNPIANITVNEGATITLSPTATDPDGDALTYTYSGWMSSASYTTNNEDTGTHTVTVTVSDGTLTDSHNVMITIIESVTFDDTTAPEIPTGVIIMGT